MTFEEFETELNAYMDNVSDEELTAELRKVGCKFVDDESESQGQYKESFKHDY